MADVTMRPPDTYFLLAGLDSGNAIAESDEDNNLVVSSTSVVIGPT